MRKVESFNHSGQAVMEFVLGLVVIFSFFIFFIRMSAVFAVGNYVHYATFMAARAYASSAPGRDEQKERANAVLDSTVRNKFKTLIKEDSEKTVVGDGPYFSEDPAHEFWNQGVAFAFKTKLSLYPWSKAGQAIDLDLVSESWMPREVTEKECNAKKTFIQSQLNMPGIKVEWDNGC